MSKNKTIYECSKCSAQALAWEGRCRECSAWGTLVETTVGDQISDQSHQSKPIEDSKLINLSDIKGKKVDRLVLGEMEIDRVLGGGLVPGSLVLLGGEPGIGKSTLVLQFIGLLSKQHLSTYYVSGEESPEQVKLRVDRLGLSVEQVKFIPITDIDKVCATLVQDKPQVAIIDSIQTVYTKEISGEAGSVSQVRAATVKLLEVAKQFDICVIIIGHVTKDGQVAGPKTLEHLVDTVLYLEGDNMQARRILRTVKNRFGSTSEVGLFEMKKQGLEPVRDVAQYFWSQNSDILPGTALTVVWEGSRPFVVEIQALVNTTTFGYPKRTVTGLDLNRVQLLLAVLSKQGKINISADDVYVNLASGLKSKDTGLDLGVLAAVISAKKNKPLNKGLIVFGEVSLTGQVKEVPYLDKRIREAVNLGFTKIVCPQTSKKISSQKSEVKQITSILELVQMFD